MLLVNFSGTKTFLGEPFREQTISASVIDEVREGSIYHGIGTYPKQTFVTGFFANELRNTIGVPVSHRGEMYALFLRTDIKFLFNEMLSRSFLQMAKKLQHVDEKRKEFISNLSHDIQSPLSNIKGYASLLSRGDTPAEEKNRYAEILQGEVQRLSSLTKQLLLLESLDREDLTVNQQPFKPADQLRNLVQSYQWAVNEKGIMLSYSLVDVEVVGDPSLLYTVWDNLLSNAIKYNKSNGSIELSMKVKDSLLEVCVADTGIGMSQAEVERMFERFYRADVARTRTIEGTGLGLSIVESIVEIHHGNIRVSSDEGVGTSVTVKLPIYE